MPAQLELQHELSICPRGAVDDLAAFLDEHWRRGHVLARSRRLLDWQHLDRGADRFNFVIARDSAGRIDAVLGFIPTSQFDPVLARHGDLWLAIWKVRGGVESAGLGLRLLGHLTTTLQPRSVGAIGLSSGVIPIYRWLGFTVGKLDHYYLVNRDKTEFSLLANFDGVYGSEPSHSLSRFSPCDEIPDTLFGEARIPAKSAAYATARYARHPLYKYEMLAITQAGKTLGAVVFREAAHGAAKALRVVDYFGDPDALRDCAGAFQSLLAERDAEYVDFYCHGLTADGFVRRTADSGVIVPNYFEPFEQRNVDLDFAWKIHGAPRGPVVMVKGDSDQDRPNLLGSEPCL
jgi:hypothetical protein